MIWYFKMVFILSVIFSESSARSDTYSDSDSDESVKRPPKKSDDKSNISKSKLFIKTSQQFIALYGNNLSKLHYRFSSFI